MSSWWSLMGLLPYCIVHWNSFTIGYSSTMAWSSNQSQRLDYMTKYMYLDSSLSNGNQATCPVILSCLFQKQCTLQWHHNECAGLSNHRRLDYLLNHLHRGRSKKTSKLRVTGLCDALLSAHLPSHCESFRLVYMITLSNGNIFRVTGPLWWNPTVTSGLPSQRPVTQSFDVFFNLRLNNSWAINRNAGDSRRHRTHYEATVMYVRYFIMSADYGSIKSEQFHMLLETHGIQADVHSTSCFVKCTRWGLHVYLTHILRSNLYSDFVTSTDFTTSKYSKIAICSRIRPTKANFEAPVIESKRED